jgi:hypothetical protein
MLKQRLRLNIKTKDKSRKGTSTLVAARHVKTQDNVRRSEMLVPGVNANRLDRSQPLLPYPNSALQCDLTRVHEAWRESRRRHDRYSVYQYLTAVFDLVMVWQKENRAIDRAKRALCLKRREGGDNIEPFAVVIRCTSPRKKVDSKACSKWARALIFAAKYKSPAESVKHFIRRHGGINSCATELSRLSRTQTR